MSAPQSDSGPTPALLTWKVTQKKMPWGIILLLGGGFALAKGCEVKKNVIPIYVFVFLFDRARSRMNQDHVL